MKDMEKIFLTFVFCVIFSIFIQLLFPGDFTTNFIADLFATLIGVIAGFQIGLFAESIGTTKIRREKAISLLTALKSEITHNKALLEQLLNELTEKLIPLYSLRLSTWEATSSENLDNINDFQLVEQISRLYFELDHLKRKIDAQFQMHYSAIRALNSYQSDRKGLIVAITVHIPPTIKICDEILIKIENQIKTLIS